MVIDIDERQREILHGMLETRLGYIAGEIRHTDTPHVRQELREERDALRALLESLGPARV